MSDNSYNINALIQELISGSSNVSGQDTRDTSDLVLAPNPHRKGIVIYNPVGICYVALSETVSPSSYTYLLTPGTTLELEHYKGSVSAIRDSGRTGFISVTEKI